MKKITCKNCKYWDEWKLPKGKTLHDFKKSLFKNARRGECRHESLEHTSTYSSTSCDNAEAKNESV